MPIELKPCPFCGGANVQVKKDPLLLNGHRYWFIVHMAKDCPLCGAFDWWHSSSKYTTEEKAIEAWNRRNDNA